MSLLLDSYRKNAQAARLESERSMLPNIRRQAALAAERWSKMADRLEWVEAQGRLRAAGMQSSAD